MITKLNFKNFSIIICLIISISIISLATNNRSELPTLNNQEIVPKADQNVNLVQNNKLNFRLGDLSRYPTG